MQTVKVQSWRITVRANPRSFDFKFRAFKIIRKFQINNTHFVSSRSSFILKLRRIFPEIKSKTSNLVAKLKSKFRRGESYRRRPRNLDFPANGSCMSFDEETVASVTGNLALLSHCVSKNDIGGIAVHAFTLSFYLISLLNKSLTTKTHLPLLLSASAVSSTGISLNYMNDKGRISENDWKAWNQVVSVGCLFIFTRIILLRISPNIKRKNLYALMTASALVPMFMKHMVPQATKEVRETIPIWIANFLLISQTMSHLITNPRNLQKLSIFTPLAPLFIKEVAYMLGPYVTA